MTIIGLYGNHVLSIPISDTIIDTALYSHHWKYFHSWVEYLLLTIMLQMIRMDNMENIWAVCNPSLTPWPRPKPRSRPWSLIIVIMTNTNTYTYKYLYIQIGIHTKCVIRFAQFGQFCLFWHWLISKFWQGGWFWLMTAHKRDFTLWLDIGMFWAVCHISQNS